MYFARKYTYMKRQPPSISRLTAKQVFDLAVDGFNPADCFRLKMYFQNVRENMIDDPITH